jgi:hypothetical protein
MATKHRLSVFQVTNKRISQLVSEDSKGRPVHSHRD